MILWINLQIHRLILLCFHIIIFKSAIYFQFYWLIYITVSSLWCCLSNQGDYSEFNFHKKSLKIFQNWHLNFIKQVITHLCSLTWPLGSVPSHADMRASCKYFSCSALSCWQYSIAFSESLLGGVKWYNSSKRTYCSCMNSWQV